MDKNKSMYPKNQPLLCLFYFLPLLEYKPLLEMYSPAEMSNINEGAYQKYSHPIRHQGILLATSLKIFLYTGVTKLFLTKQWNLSFGEKYHYETGKGDIYYKLSEILRHITPHQTCPTMTFLTFHKANI